MILELTEDIKTGVEEMYRDHQRLVELLNKVYELLREGKSSEAEEFFSKELVAWVEHHLAREERFMQAIGYPEFERHKKAHENFRKVILDLLSNVEKVDHHVFRKSLALAWGWLAGYRAKVYKKIRRVCKGEGFDIIYKLVPVAQKDRARDS